MKVQEELLTTKGMLVPKSMVNLSELFRTQKERPKSTKPERATKTETTIPHGKRFNAEQFLSTKQVEELREMRECSFEPRLSASRSRSRMSTERNRAPKGYDMVVQRLRVGYE